MPENNSIKGENDQQFLKANQKIQLDNTMTVEQALNNILVQAVQNVVSVSNMVANNAAQASNLVNTNALHLSNALNASILRHADIATDRQWNKDIAEMVAENLLLRTLENQQEEHQQPDEDEEEPK